MLLLLLLLSLLRSTPLLCFISGSVRLSVIPERDPEEDRLHVGHPQPAVPAGEDFVGARGPGDGGCPGGGPPGAGSQ